MACILEANVDISLADQRILSNQRRSGRPKKRLEIGASVLLNKLNVVSSSNIVIDLLK